MNKPIIAAAALMLASSGAWAAKMMTNCDPSQINPRAAGESRERIKMACAHFNAARDCDKAARNQGLAGAAKKDFAETCYRQAITRSQWPRR